MHYLAVKVCFRLKQQLTALEALHSAIQKENWPAISIRPEVIDVRVAQHILHPDSPSVADSPEFEEACRKVGNDPNRQSSRSLPKQRVRMKNIEFDVVQNRMHTIFT